MNSNYERLLLIKELKQLIREWDKCKDKYIRRDISTDIKLISDAIDLM
ncbi:hypothetical protein JOC77_003974 [Peribacillus deserti]|uniref:Uncharacterized protein n=1 Tax=Peribacillus deserti TaxID=673318 RepID=A0ABS2QQI5_9BACI|nr:hypothetical protein [Peribacillus deserti]MBM7694511.1 hypothetical protein [Peribacillus deserti]